MNCKSRRRSLGLLCLAVAGCSYGPVSDAAYEHAKELYTLSNLKAIGTLDAVESAIAAKSESGELPPHEARWLLEICELCRAERWEKAQSRAREIMEDQVRS